MTRKQKIILLNGILKGETPISAVFNDWPEKTYYEIEGDEDHYETESGEMVSFEEVDREFMNYPKVHIVYEEPEDEGVKLSIGHEYIRDEGTGVRDKGLEENDDGSGFSCPIKPKLVEKDLTIPNKSGLSNLNAERTANPDPPPEPFLSRKDKEVMAQGSLYCVR